MVTFASCFIHEGLLRISSDSSTLYACVFECCSNVLLQGLFHCIKHTNTVEQGLDGIFQLLDCFIIENHWKINSILSANISSRLNPTLPKFKSWLRDYLSCCEYVLYYIRVYKVGCINSVLSACIYSTSYVKRNILYSKYQELDCLYRGKM